MGESVGSTPQGRAGAQGGKTKRGRLTLELVALRGKDVIGVRHLVEGGVAWIGDVDHTLVPFSMRDWGGRPLRLGEVQAGSFTLHIPPRVRTRVHGGDGIPRIVVGPQPIELQPGERAVVVLGAVQIRAQVVPYETIPSRHRWAMGLAAWVCGLGLVYVALLTASWWFAQPDVQRIEKGALQRIHARFFSPVTQHAP